MVNCWILKQSRGNHPTGVLGTVFFMLQVHPRSCVVVDVAVVLSHYSNKYDSIHCIVLIETLVITIICSFVVFPCRIQLFNIKVFPLCMIKSFTQNALAMFVFLSAVSSVQFFLVIFFGCHLPFPTRSEGIFRSSIQSVHLKF